MTQIHGRVHPAKIPLARLGGKPILIQVVDVFQKCDTIGQIVVVLSEQNLEKGRLLLAKHDWPKMVEVCPGGARRQESVLAGLNRLTDCDWVVVHDCARPLVTEDLIERGLEAVQETGAGIAAVPVTDTIKMVVEGQFVLGTPPRQHLWVAQTPQVFRFDIITEAHRHAKDEVTDDATLVERLGHRVKLYLGSYHNIKITTPDDLALARLLWRKYGK